MIVSDSLAQWRGIIYLTPLLWMAALCLFFFIISRLNFYPLPELSSTKPTLVGRFPSIMEWHIPWLIEHIDIANPPRS